MSWLLWFVALLAGLLWLAEMVGSAWYDVRMAAAERARRLHPHARRYRQRPLVSVVIVASGQPITECLQSVRASSYRKTEVIVIANGVPGREYRHELAGRGRLVAKRKALDHAAAVQSARRQIHGGIVLVLDATAHLDRRAIGSAVMQFNCQPDTAWLLPNIQTSAPSISGIFQSYTQLLATRANKLRSLLALPLAVDGPAIFYRRDQLLNHSARGLFAADVLVTSVGIHSLREWWRAHYEAQIARWQRLTADRHWRDDASDALPLALSLSLPITMGYALYLALRLQQTWLLGLGLAAAAIVLISAIWDNPQLSLMHKWRYVAGLPVAAGFWAVALVANAANQLMLLARAIEQRWQAVTIS